MKDQMRNTTRPEVFRIAGLAMLALGLMMTTGCNELERDDGDGVEIDGVVLPNDTLLNLSCADMGVYVETCVLNDRDNPFRNTVIREFDVNNPGAENKFELWQQIPDSPQYRKARVYFWATALARRPSGENQWYTAQALHALYDINDDPVIQAQALRAYRSVLDNFFDSVTFFTCCAEVNDGVPVPFSVPLNELAAMDVYGTGDVTSAYARLVPGVALLAQELLAEWGYTYTPEDGISINGG